MLNSKFSHNLRTLLSLKKYIFKNAFRKKCDECPCQLQYMDICGKLAVVTGGTSEIGLNIAKQLLEKSPRHVVLAGTDECEGEEAVCKLKAVHGEGCCSFYNLDVTDCKAFEDLFQILECKGGVDILINNEEIMGDKDWHREIAVNFAGLARACLTALEHMKCESVIINMASGLAIDPLYKVPIYSATKHAVLALHHSLGDKQMYEECGIRFVAMCPAKTVTKTLKKMRLNIYKGTMEKKESKYQSGSHQDPIHVAKGVIYGIEYGGPGETFLIETKNLFKVKFPCRTACSKLIASYVSDYLREPVY